MDSQTSARRRRSVQVNLVYSNQPGAATEVTLRPQRSWLASLMELLGLGRFGGLGGFGRFSRSFQFSFGS